MCDGVGAGERQCGCRRTDHYRAEGRRDESPKFMGDVHRVLRSPDALSAPPVRQVQIATAATDPKLGQPLLGSVAPWHPCTCGKDAVHGRCMTKEKP